MRSLSKAALWAIGGLAALGSLAALVTFQQARRSLRQADEDVRAESIVAFERKLWTGPGPGVEAIPAAPGFRDAVRFSGRLYLAGAGGVRIFDPSGGPEGAWRPGLEAPPAPITDLAVGLDPVTGRTTLLAATAGEGLLAISANGALEQIRAVSPADRDLTALLPLDDGRILLGTQQAGVLVYDSGGMAPLHAGLRDLHVTALAGDESELWIGTLDEGVVRFAGGAIERISPEAGLPDRHVLSLAIDDGVVYAHNVYVGTAGGVAEIRNGQVVRTLAEGVIASALAVDAGRLIVGSFDQGVAEIALDLSRRAGRASWRDHPAETRRLVRLDSEAGAESDGELYAVAADGLYALGSGADLLPASAALTDRNISALHAASDGRLWVGYFDRGLDLLDASGALLAHVEDDTIFCVNRIVEDARRGIVYVATANGLALFSRDGRLREVRSKADGLIANHVTDIAVRDGSLTVATPAGLTFFGPGGPRSLYALQGLVNNHVYALGGRGAELLAGTLGGLSMLEGDVVRRSSTTANSNLGHNWITAVEEFQGDWYLGTYGAGVVRLREDGGFDNPGELAGVEINPHALAVAATSVGANLLAGSLDRGVLVYGPESERWTEHTAGLPSLNVTAIEAMNGIVYVGTENGLVTFADSALRWR